MSWKIACLNAKEAVQDHRHYHEQHGRDFADVVATEHQGSLG
jgi:hypothetical protein